MTVSTVSLVADFATLVAKDLDDRIVAVFSVLGLLIAVTSGYLAAIWPVIATMLGASTPEASDDRETLADRCLAYMWGCIVVAATTLSIGLIMLSTVVDVARRIPDGGSFNPIRGSALLFFVLVCLALAAATRLALRLRKRSVELQR